MVKANKTAALLNKI